MKVRFLKIAQHEVDDAVAWYESQARELGHEFLHDLDRAVRRASAFPLSCAEVEPGLRRSLLTRFPYGLIYAPDQDTIIVLAVTHLHREPHYWIDRTGGRSGVAPGSVDWRIDKSTAQGIRRMRTKAKKGWKQK